MKNTAALQSLITDEQILECLILFETRRMDASKLLAAYLYDKWQISTINAHGILLNIKKEWDGEKEQNAIRF